MRIGDELGEVMLKDDTTIDAGRALFRDTWNVALQGLLAASFDESQKSALSNVLFHKNRNSDMCEAMTDCIEYLEKGGLRTLLFCGMNIDQGVLSTLFKCSDERVRYYHAE